MSLLLSQPSFCVRKPLLVRSSPLLSNDFSTSLPQNPPPEMICLDPCRPKDCKLVRSRLKGITVTTWVNQYSLWCREKVMIGTSNGWTVCLDDGHMRLQDFPDDYSKNLKLILLPPLETLPLCQTQMFTNVAMSSSFPHEEDCVVAVKFLGPQLSFCRPVSNKPEWINVRIENPCFFSSGVMFSKKDEMFHIVGSGGHVIGSWDLHEHKSKFQNLQFHNLPEFSKTKCELLDSCCTSEHLVESPTTGETFMVKWYKKTAESISSMETKAVMVFKLDDEGNAVYTQDIGDLVIFLTKSEVYCAPASSLPKGRRNCVKIWDVDETKVVDLTAQ